MRRQIETEQRERERWSDRERERKKWSDREREVYGDNRKYRWGGQKQRERQTQLEEE